MSLAKQLRLRDAVDGLCAAIDAGTVQPGEREMCALAMVVSQECGPLLKYDLLVKLAARCKNGRDVLARMAH